MKNKTYKVPKRRQPFFSVVKAILKIFYKRPKIINLAGELPDKCIILANHSAKQGPMGLELYFPLFTVKWAAHQMTGNYFMRRRYLKDVFYTQKQGYGKVRAWLLATFEAIFSKMMYKGIKYVGTYQNAGLIKTLHQSAMVLDSNAAVMIFPENSNDGYFEEMTEFFPGFVLLAQYYYKKTGEDLPVYPCYYHTKKHILVIDKPDFVNQMLQNGMDRNAIAQTFKNRVNNLLHTYCKSGT